MIAATTLKGLSSVASESSESTAWWITVLRAMEFFFHVYYTNIYIYLYLSIDLSIYPSIQLTPQYPTGSFAGSVLWLTLLHAAGGHPLGQSSLGVYWWDPWHTIYSSTVRILWDIVRICNNSLQYIHTVVKYGGLSIYLSIYWTSWLKSDSSS